MGNLTGIALIVLALNVLLVLGAYTIDDLSDGSQALGYDCQDTLFKGFSGDGGNCSELNTSTFQENLPSTTPFVDITSGNVFTDTFNAIKGWVLDNTGLGFVLDLLTAPYRMIALIGMPPEVTFILGALWYGLTFFLIIAWIKGGDA